MSDRGGGGFDWEGAEDVTTLSEEELKEGLGGLVEEERALSHRRRVLQGRVDLIRAELVQLGVAVRLPKELVRALMGGWGP